TSLSLLQTSTTSSRTSTRTLRTTTRRTNRAGTSTSTPGYATAGRGAAANVPAIVGGVVAALVVTAAAVLAFLLWKRRVKEGQLAGGAKQAAMAHGPKHERKSRPSAEGLRTDKEPMKVSFGASPSGMENIRQRAQAPPNSNSSTGTSSAEQPPRPQRVTINFGSVQVEAVHIELVSVSGDRAAEPQPSESTSSSQWEVPNPDGGNWVRLADLTPGQVAEKMRAMGLDAGLAKVLQEGGVGGARLRTLSDKELQAAVIEMLLARPVILAFAGKIVRDADAAGGWVEVAGPPVDAGGVAADEDIDGLPQYAA
ncbi:hypothetical protein HDU96_002951, partial [Phlyctochytrium bullatum]